jgi:hypothetical protein
MVDYDVHFGRALNQTKGVSKWYEKNPQFWDIAPEDAVMRAAAEKWPCK